MSRQIVWLFRVAPEKREEFERVYGPEGDWAQLFAKAKNFRGTTLLRDPAIGGRYLTVDVWESDEALERFAQEFATEYQALDKRCEALTESEMKIGAFDGL